ncbi:MAG: hypothetical protein DSO07_07280 [Thermoproteota archaeon]|uniref:Uncharacterized protein n=1 Tax=Candidatus Methanodesulfokora washburnensis TaxID=2478471 RepID=A0A429GCY4_9CREN|nr:hypothetical protein [Candidatus Methanodesulfokores washburnensis]RSN71646.1 hypothetical protein D6D85_15670 [Candidatus Methanodesulfokores washburnensis]TDA40930.1 MAG: hypothetical protein DSO07_07280 [Candidatus Korarchaeota archaeon]
MSEDAFKRLSYSLNQLFNTISNLDERDQRSLMILRSQLIRTLYWADRCLTDLRLRGEGKRESGDQQKST